MFDRDYTKSTLVRLHNAVGRGDIKAIETCLASGTYGVDVESSLPSEYDSLERTPLLKAAGSGQIEVIKFLMKRGANVAACDTNGDTALHMIASRHNIDMMCTLLAAGANLRATNNQRLTALDSAIKADDFDMVKFIIERGLPKGYWHMTVAVHNIEILKYLLARGGDPDCRPWDADETALIIASRRGSLEAIRLLIRAKADVNKQVWSSEHTALMEAVKANCIDGIKELLLAKAKPDLQDNKGNTALMFAAERNKLEAAKLLLGAGANPDVKNKAGLTAVDIAKARKNDAIVELLLPGFKAKAEEVKGKGEGAGFVVPAFGVIPYGFKAKAEEVKSKAEGAAVVIPAFGVIPYEHLKFSGKILGEGGFGIVKQAKWQFYDVAVKQFKVSHLPEDTLAEFKKEAEIHAKLRHPNIVNLYGICVEPVKYCMVMELMLKGSLYGVLRNSSELPWPVRLSIAKDIAQGLSYLHDQGIVHRDLKSLNVLLDDRMRAKLSDFGVSKVKAEATTTVGTGGVEVGSVLWMAPELFKRGAKCTELSDLYALGVVYWEIASRKIPFADARGNAALVIDWVKSGEREAIPTDAPTKFADLIRQCWDQTEAKRPRSAKEVIAALARDDAPAAAGAGSDSRVRWDEAPAAAGAGSDCRVS